MQCRINFVQTLVFYSVNYQSRLDTGWTLYIYCPKITFSTAGRRLGHLFPNIVPTLVINSRSSTLDQHLADRHSRQSVIISAWVHTGNLIIFTVFFYAHNITVNYFQLKKFNFFQLKSNALIEPEIKIEKNIISPTEFLLRGCEIIRWNKVKIITGIILTYYCPLMVVGLLKLALVMLFSLLPYCLLILVEYW